MPKLSPIRLTETIEIGNGQSITYSRDFKTIKALAQHVGCSRWTVKRYMSGESDYCPLKRFKLEFIEELEDEAGHITQPQLEENSD
jgi:AraC-like DNA-binding protein